MKKLAEAIHQGGAKAVAQMSSHMGGIDEVDPASPSGIPHPWVGASPFVRVRPRIITAADLEELVAEYGESARRIMEAGFDGVMIHGANGYLLCELLSQRFNTRNDAYGGDLKGRAKYLLDMIQEVKEKTSPDFPVIVRLMGSDRIPKQGNDGWGVADCIELCKLLEAIGVAAIDITSGSNQETLEWTVPLGFMPSGLNADITADLKRSGIKTPISITGKIGEPLLAEKILREGKADFVCIGRGLIADPYWPTKVKEGRLQDIRWCIYDKRCGEDVSTDFVPMSCTVNPVVGREKEFIAKMTRLTKKKKVLVIGGGPGGMQAAIIAAQKGHDVTLLEKSVNLGGQLIIAAVPPDKQDLINLISYLKFEIAKAGVKLVMNKEATPEIVEEFAPDSVIVAVGSSPSIPDIPGAKGKNVMNCRDVLSGQKKVGKKVIVIGGGYVGCETCFFLANKGIDLTLVFRSPEPALDIKLWESKVYYQNKLKENNIKVMPKVTYGKITANGMFLTNQEAKEVFLEADNIVLATGSTPNKVLGEALKGKYLEFAEIGDCVEPRRIREAIEEGIWAAAAI
jgi:2,4-dienoyl-CoA reductase-like NADH-dependent reductase (Old Yellow Enzyme family)/NADPH-dependent 2,4-dienoyl-CoA reductase/sulfur reductase-like enzyme